MPVLPLVASTTVWPGLNSPDFSAASITPSARRSFTEPSGLKASTFTHRFTPGGPRRLIFTTGVRPTVSRMFWYLAMRQTYHPRLERARTGSAAELVHLELAQRRGRGRAQL